MKNDILEAMAKNSVFGTDEVHRVYEIFKSYDLLVLGCDYAIKHGYSNLETACILAQSVQKSVQADGVLCPICDFEQKTDQVCEEHGVYKITPRKKYLICEKCEIHHFENCGSCFGFGVYSVPERPGEVFPVTADEAIETKEFRGEVKACPECGSTVLGLPTLHIN